MEKGYAGQGTWLGIVFFAVILAAIGMTSVVADASKAQTPPLTPEAMIEAEPPAAIPIAASSSAPTPDAAAPSAAEKAQDELKALLQAWRNAWASRDVAAYLAFYAADFQGNADSPEQWQANRKRIIGQAKTIDIRVGQVDIDMKNGESATISFPLDYASDRFKDSGTKVLEVRRDNGHWLIAGETFTAK